MTDSGQFVKAPAMISGQRRSTFRHTETNKAPEPKALTEKDMEFMARMDGDINQRRKNKFVNELSARFPRPARPDTLWVVSTVRSARARWPCAVCASLSP